MRYFDELSYEEISEKLDLPLGTVKAQLFRARDLLYSILKNSQAGI
jgi:RNA polymerase sigma-70 factor (ECF subfamily)